MSKSSTIQKKMSLLSQQRDLFEQAKAYAYEYMDGISERAVAAFVKAREDSRS